MPLLRLVDEETLTSLEKRDILNEITNLLIGFNIANIVSDVNLIEADFYQFVEIKGFFA